MTRPNTLRGLVWRLAKAYPAHSLAVMVAGVALCAVAGDRDRASAEACTLTRAWSAGDVHYNERLDFREDGTGRWIQSGHAEDAGQQRLDFRWHVDGATLAVTTEEHTRRVQFAIEQRHQRCALAFDEHPLLDDESGFLRFTAE